MNEQTLIAFKAISEIAGTGVFVLAGQDTAKGVLERIDQGQFTYSLQGVNFGLTELVGSGVFLLTGQDAFKAISEFADVGLFTLTMQDVLVWKPRYEFQNEKQSAALFASGPNSAMLLSEKNEAA